MNPFLYAFLSTSFRQSFHRALGCRARGAGISSCCSCIETSNLSAAAAAVAIAGNADGTAAEQDVTRK